MKKYLLLVIIVSAVSSSVFAQKIKESDVPAPVRTAFTKSYPGQTAKWEKEKGNFEAEFKMGDKNMSATFQPTGMFLESETSIKEAELPASVLNYIKTNYKDKKIKESAKITSSTGVVTYEAEVDGKDVIFDSNGKFLKEVKD